AGLLSVPGKGPEKAQCAQSILNDRHGIALTVHRLDMDTSGIMVFARTKDAQRHLSRSFERRLITKHYLAIVDGIVTRMSGMIDFPIARYSLQRPLRHIAPDGQEAITHWQVLERNETTTRLRLSPTTGRSHQLRLHLSVFGHAILGDSLYGDPASAQRLLLHAESLSFLHPNTEKSLSFSALPPF
ncbi:MAG: RluA family pseudouridine synthase, partial [Henriciella sp.]|nr:RluA family pseudouridine synthase [Henriciella sp.]